MRKNSGQRDFMRQLWHDFSGDRERVVQEYAKGWLESRVTIDNQTDTSFVIPTNSPSVNTAASRPQATRTSTDREKWIKAWFDGLEIRPESLEYLDRVVQWRLAWRPHRVRILLVAESHVAEQDGDIDCNVELPEGLAPNLSLPKGFCRLVYCLGYGEKAICYPTLPDNNQGTWQFWDLLGSIGAVFDSSISSKMPRKANSNSSLATRIQWKISLLNILADAGVWLEDASVIGIYRSGKRMVSGKRYDQIVRESFKNFVWPGVVKDNPVQVWVIGRSVGNALIELPMIYPDRIISQPGDHNASRYQADVERLVRGVGSV